MAPWSTTTIYPLILDELNEKQRRRYVASEALRIGFGGISQVSRDSGISRVTITAGIKELKDQTPSTGRIRRSGGGRKKLSAKQPRLETLVEHIADPQGDPMSPIRWTSHSMEKIAGAVTALGQSISTMSVYRLLKEKGFALRANKKELEGKQHPDRNAQFEHINRIGLRLQLSGAPILSVDCKKTELIGNFKNNGREWQPEGSDTTVNVYDFGEKDAAGQRIKAIPYGVYNVLKKQGFVNVGIDHNTAEFAVESIRRYWLQFGKQAYPEATELLILADGGSSNGSKNRLWKLSLQQLATEIALTIHVCHYPPGTSKWNAIEHDLFAFISMNWRAKPLLSYSVMLELLNHTTTKAGLTVTAMKDIGTYQTGIKVTDNEMAALNIQRDEFHGEWNYSIRPKQL